MGMRSLGMGSGAKKIPRAEIIFYSNPVIIIILGTRQFISYVSIHEYTT